MDPEKVPEPLRNYIEIVDKWGAVNSDSERYELADRAEADEAALEELRNFAASWTDAERETLDAWLDESPITESYEGAKFYFATGLVAELDLWPGSESKGPEETVDQHIKALGKHGSLRLASERMWAARFLLDYGDAARKAIPALTQALGDDDTRVRIWAHCALAMLEGDVEPRRFAIALILDQHSEEDEYGCKDEIGTEAEEALKELSRSPEERDLEALTSACITGEVFNVNRLISRVDVNKRDHNDQVPLQYAVGNSLEDIVAILLNHNADPNVRDSEQQTPLHDAAMRRDSENIIRLLVEHGADINAVDEYGQTPIDLAKDCRRKSNVKLLRKLKKKK